MHLSEKEWFAFIAGLTAGRHRLQSLNNVSDAVTTNRKPIRITRHTTIGITAGCVYCDNRQYKLVRVPIMCTGVNIGVAAFVAKITWDGPYATYVGVDYGDFGSNIVIDDSQASSNTIIVRGQNQENMPLQDFVLFYLDLLVQNVPETLDRIYIYCIKTTGTSMDDCSLLTIKDGGLYWITPIEANTGFIYFDKNNGPRFPNPTFEQSGPSYFPIGTNVGETGTWTPAPVGGLTTAQYSLTGYLGGAGGTGAWIVVSIFADGVLIGQDRQYVEVGKFRIGGKINLKALDPGYKDIKIKIEVEPEEGDDTPYYLLIPAEGFNIFFSTEINEEDRTFPKEPIRVMYLEKLEVADLHEVDIYSREEVDLDNVTDKVSINDFMEDDLISVNIHERPHVDELSINDVFTVDVGQVNILESENIDKIGVLDLNNIDFEGFKEPADVNLTDDNLSLSDMCEIEKIPVVITEEDYGDDELSLSDVCEIEKISIVIIDEDYEDCVSINDTYNIDFD